MAYFSDAKKSYLTERASVVLTGACDKKEINLDQPAEFSSILEKVPKGKATHLVSGIQYYTMAVFVFERKKVAENDQPIKSLTQLLKDLNEQLVPRIADLEKIALTEDQKKEFEKITCTYYGDFELEKKPEDLLEAIAVFENLSNLQLNKDVKPLTIWLTPLLNIDEASIKVINPNTVDLLGNYLQNLRDVESVVEIMRSSKTYPPPKVLLGRLKKAVREKIYKVLKDSSAVKEAECKNLNIEMCSVSQRWVLLREQEAEYLQSKFWIR
jgi:hypothetical protein